MADLPGEMEDIVLSLHDSLGMLRNSKIGMVDLDCGSYGLHICQVAAAVGEQRIRDVHVRALPNQRIRKVTANEPEAAGNQDTASGKIRSDFQGRVRDDHAATFLPTANSEL